MMPEAPPEASLSQAPTMQHPKRWPLVNTLASRSDDFSKDARIINGYAEKSALTGSYSVEKRPGFAFNPIVAGAAKGRGLYGVTYLRKAGNSNFLGYNNLVLYLTGNDAFPANVYIMVTDAAGTTGLPILIGTVDLGNTGPGTYPTKVQFLSFYTASIFPTILFGAGATAQLSGPKAYYYDGLTLSTLQPGVNNFPASTVPGFAYLNGFIYVMDYLGTIWETLTQNQVANWDPLGFVTAATDSDLGVQLARQLVYIVAIKTWTTQFFYDNGNTTGSSLSPLPGAIYDFGCLSADTFADLDGVFFWATQSKQGTYRIVMIKDLQHEFVSSPAVERQLDLGPGSTWYSLAYQHAGHRWYVITNLTTNVTMVYDIGEKLWHLWTDFQGNFYPVIARTTGPNGKEWHQMGASGSIYELGADYIYPNDMGNVVPVDIYTPNFDDGVDREKFLYQMRFEADQTKGSNLLIRSSDDDYKTWTNYRSVDLGRKRPIITDEGSFYRRAYHFRHYANTKFRISAVDLAMDRGVF